MAAAGSGLGSAGFVVLDDTVDLAAVAAGVARFLAVESCGQCTPCKQDGLAIASALAALIAGQGDETDATTVIDCLSTVADGARCALASQQQVVLGSLLDRHPELLGVRTVDDGRAPMAPMLIAELVDLPEGSAIVDERFATKQPDWTYDDEDSGQSPVERLTDHRAAEARE
jgi:hypothetical protein